MDDSGRASNPGESHASSATLLGRAWKWCQRGWLRARGGLKDANERVAKQFTALAERQSSTRAEVERLESAFRELRANVATLHERIRELEARERGEACIRGGVSINLSSKSQVLKLSRNGQSARTIAATLGVPVGEVEFLLKVHRLLNRTAERRQMPAGEGNQSLALASTATGGQDGPSSAPAWGALREAAGVQ